MEKASKKSRQFPFWLQIVLILAVGAAVSVIILLVARSRSSDREKGDTFTVTFCYQDGTLIDQMEAERGKGVEPPQYIGEEIFRGWNTAINYVTSDTEAHPILYQIVEDNLFYFDSVYVQEGSAFSLDLFVGGNVNVSSGSLTIEYDPDVLSYQRTSGLCEASEDEPGVLRLEFSEDAPITEKTQLASIKFEAKEVDAYSTEVLLSAEEATLRVKGTEQAVDFATINNQVFFLQELT